MGGQGTHVENITSQAAPAQVAPSGRALAGSNPEVAQILADYGSGKLGLDEAMTKARTAAGSRYGSSKQAVEDKYAKLIAEQQAKKQSIQAKQQAAGKGSGLQIEKYGRTAEDDKAYGDADKEIERLRAAHDQEINALGPDTSGAETSAIQDLFTTSPMAAQRYITDTLQSSPLTGRLFGKGGELDKSIAQTEEFKKYGDTLQQEERDLASRGYSLKPEDYEAYGQMSNELARTFGAQEKGAAADLARRGLMGGESGRAGVLYSGMAGNKAEQLAAAQRQVADARMKMNLQRLESQRNFLNQQRQLGLSSRGQTMGLGQLQSQEAQNLFGRNLAGRQMTSEEAKTAAEQARAFTEMQQQQLNKQFEQEQATKPPGVGEILGSILGTAGGALTGGFGAGLGKAAGSAAGKLFGGSGTSASSK